MKAFKAPMAEVVYFGKEDVIVTSTCPCVDCTVCPEGKDNCSCVDFGGNE